MKSYNRIDLFLSEINHNVKEYIMQHDIETGLNWKKRGSTIMFRWRHGRIEIICNSYIGSYFGYISRDNGLELYAAGEHNSFNDTFINPSINTFKYIQNEIKRTYKLLLNDSKTNKKYIKDFEMRLLNRKLKRELPVKAHTKKINKI